MTAAEGSESNPPPRLRFGVATSAFQIEGSLEAHGRGRSVWDDFCAVPGKIEGGHDASVACDHYRRWQQDLDLLEWLEVDCYRFSVSWPRVMPEGRGRVETRGLDFYDKLVDGLLARDIEPWVTLFHWDVPSPLWTEHRAWLGRGTAEAFGEYAAVVFARLGDRVRHWLTLNEPRTIYSMAGYQLGVHAPGHQGTFGDLLTAAHHQLLGHALAKEAFHAGGHVGQVGYGEAFSPHRYPAEGMSSELRKEALEFDFFWYERVIRSGIYPLLDKHPALVGLLPRGFEADCERIHRAGSDFLGVNYYTPRWLSADADHALGWKSVGAPDGEVNWRNSLHWPVVPGGIAEVVETLHQGLPGVPLHITENGMCDELPPTAGGRVVEDGKRVRFLSEHLEALEGARARGVPVGTYFHWSFMDNFEWVKGYRPRFGLVSVDYLTQERRPKRSAHWYREHIAGRKRG